MSYWLRKMETAKITGKPVGYIPEWVPLTIAAYDELLKSEMRKEYGNDISDADFLGDMWGQRDEEVYEASPSLEKAFVKWVADQVEGFLSDCDYKYQSVERARKHIMGNVSHRDEVRVCGLDDWHEDATSIFNELLKRRQVIVKA